MENPGGRATLIIVCGLPGSGKTTHARQLEATFHAIRFCPDEWMDTLSINLYHEEARARIEALQWALTQQLLSRGVSVIIEWGTWARAERDTLRLGARSLGATVELHYLDVSTDILFERIQRRNRENPPIEQAAVEQWANIFQAPTLDETALFDKFITFAD